MGSQSHDPTALPAGKKAGTHCRGGWVEPRAILTGAENSSPTGIRSPDRPAQSCESLYQLRYPGLLSPGCFRWYPVLQQSCHQPRMNNLLIKQNAPFWRTSRFPYWQGQSQRRILSDLTYVCRKGWLSINSHPQIICNDPLDQLHRGLDLCSREAQRRLMGCDPDCRVISAVHVVPIQAENDGGTSPPSATSACMLCRVDTTKMLSNSFSYSGPFEWHSVLAKTRTAQHEEALDRVLCLGPLRADCSITVC